VGELAAFAQGRNRSQIRLSRFLSEQCLEVDDIYSSTRQRAGWTALRRAAGLESGEEGPDEAYLGKRFAALLHITDGERVALLRRIAQRDPALRAPDPRSARQLQMLAYQLFGKSTDLMDGNGMLDRFDASPLAREELGELADWLDLTADLEPEPLPGVPADWPLLLHGHYTRAEILSAAGFWHAQARPSMFEGKLGIKALRLQLLFVTLDKKEGFHERIAYHDYAISPELFHWQSQNNAAPDTASGRIYTQSASNGWRFQLFVRETTEHPFVALGPAVLEGEPVGARPMSMVWRLERAIPLALFRRFSVLRN